MNDIKRFISIIPYDSKVFWKSLIGYWSRTLYNLVGVIFLSIITTALEWYDTSWLVKALRWYWWSTAFVLFFMTLTHDRSWPEIWSFLKKRIYAKYLPEYIKIDISYTEKIGTGKTLSIIEKGVDSWWQGISYCIMSFSSLFLTLSYVIYSLSLLWASYVWYFFIIVAGSGTFAYFLNKKMLKQRKKRVNAKNNYVRGLVKVIMSKVEIMQKGTVLPEIQSLDHEMNSVIDANKKMSLPVHRFFFGPRIAIDVGKILLFSLAGLAVIQSWSWIGTIVAVGWWLILLDNVLDKFLEFYKNITKEFDIVKRMRDFFDNAPITSNYDQWTAFMYKKWNITLHNIVFSYHHQLPIIENFSLAIDGGTKVALVGPSGGGKSTIVKLVAGYLRPDSWIVSVDGQDLSDINLKSYYKHIGYLTQEPSVFDGTIRENLTYAVDGVDDETIKQAITDAQCDFIWDLADGLDTEIGERWVRLSWWQRQRLAIAKIFLKNPEIIILDEPTSALDSESEEKVTIAMNRLFEWRTVIVIAHRLQTVKHSDTIFYIENGKVAEQGNHTELMAQQGKYYQMVELQSGF